MSGSRRKVVLFGGSGQIGGALRHILSLRSCGEPGIVEHRWADVTCPGQNRIRPEFLEQVDEECGSGKGTDFVFANGVTDPAAPFHDLNFSNRDFPLMVMERTRRFGPVRFLTLGTVFERLPGFADANPYVRSKRELQQAAAALARDKDGRVRAVHLRLHTVYGGLPKPHMFIGAIARALKTGTAFEMTAGNQLREYHHSNDIACSILQVLGREWDFEPVLEVHSGAPVKLADLARAIFGHFGRMDLLRIGALENPEIENWSARYPRSPDWLLPCYRDPMAGIVDTLERYLEEEKRA